MDPHTNVHGKPDIAVSAPTYRSVHGPLYDLYMDPYVNPYTNHYVDPYMVPI